MEILNAGLAERLMHMAKFRNLLVHLYWEVDNSRVYKIIKDDINDIDAYLKVVSDYVAEHI